RGRNWLVRKRRFRLLADLATHLDPPVNRRESAFPSDTSRSHLLHIGGCQPFPAPVPPAMLQSCGIPPRALGSWGSARNTRTYLSRRMVRPACVVPDIGQLLDIRFTRPAPVAGSRHRHTRLFVSHPHPVRGNPSRARRT